MSLDVRAVSKQNIWSFRQNKIKYILQDCKHFGIDVHLIRLILLARGVNKWLANRMRFIQLKHEIRKEITRAQEELGKTKEEKHFYHAAKLKGYMKAKEEDLRRLHEICHSDRWQWPE